jgi:hypothetical protein
MNGAAGPAQKHDNGESQTAGPSSHSLFILPRVEGNGFRASVRGFSLDLHDPSSYALSPTTDDLFIVSLAAAAAWSARDFLRERELPDYVSVTATWQAQDDPPSPAKISLTVTVSERAEAEGALLATELATSLAARSLAHPDVRISFEGV